MRKLQLVPLLLLMLITACKDKTETTSSKKNVETIKNKKMNNVKYKTENVNGVKIAYREAGDSNNPTIVLLHGFPSSSHQYRKVLNQLSNEYYLIAPDYPGFGNSDFPSQKEYEYTFDNIAKTINSFLEQKAITSYAIMIQDYGAPIGFRIATAHPDRITAIINQNGNAYEEGLEWQYTHGTRNSENINPDTWHLDYLRLSRPNAHAVNLDLFYDYQNNIKLYPKWQQYLRDNQPPLLIVWGKNDAFFPESGAEAFKKDVKNINYNIYNTGHFALEEDADKIIPKMRSFLHTLKK